MDNSNFPPPSGNFPQPSDGAGGSEPMMDVPLMQPPAPVPAYAGSAAVTTPKRRNIGASISVAAILVLLVAGIAGYLVFNKVANRPSVAVERLLPANTLFFASVDTSPDGDQKGALEKMKQAFESQPGFKEAWANFAELTSDKSGASPKASEPDGFDSLAQYVGNNMTFAMLPVSTDELNKLQAPTTNGDLGTIEDTMLQNSAAYTDLFVNHAVGIIDLDFNPLNKKGPISDLKAQADKFTQAPLVETYREVEVRKYVTGTNTIYFSLLNGTSTAVVAGKPASLHAVIDQFKDGKGIAADATYQSLLKQVPDNRVATMYMNMGELYKIAALAGGTSMVGELQGLLNIPTAQITGSVVMSLSAQDAGMQLDVASASSMGDIGIKMNPAARPDPALVSDLPSGSLAFLMGTDLKTTLQSALDVMRKQATDKGQALDSPNPVTQAIDDIAKSTGLDVEKDVLPLLGGDYALSVASYGQSGSFAPSVVFQVKLNDKDVSTATATLEKFVNSISGGAAEKMPTEKDPFYTLAPDSGMYIGVSNGRLVFVFEADPTAAPQRVHNVVTGTGKGLGSTPQWQDVPRHLPKDSNTIFYMDINGMRSVFEHEMQSSGDDNSEYEKTAAPFIRPLKYLSVGSSTEAGTTDGMSHNHTVLFLGISK